MKYGSNSGGSKGCGYSKGTHQTNSTIKVGRSEGLKMSHLSDHAAGMPNKAGNKYSLATVNKERRGQ
jgi:hypothetical protein